MAAGTDIIARGMAGKAIGDLATKADLVNGKVPASQLPSYVDDVVEVENYAALPNPGETGKLYLAKDTNNLYRWSGTQYVSVSGASGGLQLGETSSTAYRGDRGKAAYDHSQLTSGNPHAVTKSDVGLGNVTNDAQVKRSEMGASNGVATLDSNGKVPSSQLPGGISTLDTDVKLSSQLKTFYNIGKVQNASGTNPVVIGNAGDSIRDVLNNLTQMDEAQPSIVTQPAISTMTISSSDSDEYGTEITSVAYSISTSQGSYTYAPNPTGVSWSKYTFTGGCASIDKATTSGTLTLSSTYTVGVSTTVAFTCVGTHSAGNIAKTNLGNDSNPIVRIASGTKSKSVNFSKAAVAYPYYTSTSATTTPTSGTKGSLALETTGSTIAYTANKYLWIFSTTNNASKKIMIYSDLTQEWSEMLGGTQAPVSVTFTMANGKTRTYYAYRTTNVAQSSGTANIKLA